MHQRIIWALAADLFKIENGGPSKLGSEISVGETQSHGLRQSNDWFMQFTMMVRVFPFKSISISMRT